MHHPTYKVLHLDNKVSPLQPYFDTIRLSSIHFEETFKNKFNCQKGFGAGKKRIWDATNLFGPINERYLTMHELKRPPIAKILHETILMNKYGDLWYAMFVDYSQKILS